MDGHFTAVAWPGVEGGEDRNLEIWKSWKTGATVETRKAGHDYKALGAQPNMYKNTSIDGPGFGNRKGRDPGAHTIGHRS